MADSEILKLQDKNGDGLIDICGVALPRDETRCLECKPNPSAIVPRWRKRDVYSPFLNQKSCKFQITYTTPYTTTGGENTDSPTEANEVINSRFLEFAEDAITELINYFNKELNPGTLEEVLESVEYTEYDLEATASSHLRADFEQGTSIVTRVDLLSRNNKP